MEDGQARGGRRQQSKPYEPGGREIGPQEKRVGKRTGQQRSLQLERGFQEVREQR